MENTPQHESHSPAIEPVELDLIDAEEACKEIGGKDSPIHAATLYRGVKRGLYPRPIKVGPNISRWNRPEIRAALKKLLEGRDIKTV